MGKNYSESFEGLEAWKEARKLRNSIKTVIATFPAEEKYKLNNQIIRSSRSITANIAEGYGRFHYQENIQSCRMARGSLTESLDHLICAFDEGYINAYTLQEFRKQYELVLKILNGYISYLKRKKNEIDPNEDP